MQQMIQQLLAHSVQEGLLDDQFLQLIQLQAREWDAGGRGLCWCLVLNQCACRAGGGCQRVLRCCCSCTLASIQPNGWLKNKS